VKNAIPAIASIGASVYAIVCIPGAAHKVDAGVDLWPDGESPDSAQKAWLKHVPDLPPVGASVETIFRTSKYEPGIRGIDRNRIHSLSVKPYIFPGLAIGICHRSYGKTRT
jgi:hypothetical protein